MIYVILTTSLISFDYEIRKKQYIYSINRILEITKNKNYKIIIIENNGKRTTFLDDFGVDVFYTNNNSINTKNKGIKELHDILDCIKYYNIHDDDMIVKLTGRYIVDIDSEVFKVIDKNENDIDCVIKYGWFGEPSDTKLDDCILVLIANRCRDIKKIKMPEEDIALEWNWAKMTTEYISANRVHKVNKLGIYIYYNNKYV
jgi:hypothetical protein